MPNKKKQSQGEKQGKNGYAFSAPFFLLASLGIVAVAASLWFVLGTGENQIDEIVHEPIDLNITYEGARHPLSGARVDDDETFKLFAVMVENSQDAWPLSGIEDSYLVYEAPVEGDITRFMAMYSDDQDVDEIGPVRSARPYYVDFVMGWSALYTHVGGSPEALEQIMEREVFDLNEFFNGGSFWRSRRRSAPHNVYTETSRLIKAWDREIGEEQGYQRRLFKEGDLEGELPEEHEVEVEFNGYGYDVTWVYDPEQNAYVRHQAGREYKLRSGAGIVVQNVAIMKTDMRVIDDIGRQKITTVGGGDAQILIDGTVIDGTWEKDLRSTIMRFYDDEGDEIVWNVGKTWIEVVDEDRNEI
ncbi:MAG TPA: DUF3048 domain-containing protein [Patescibacteria group bacterium]|nr:DUF3048 domain-containing protein [Patescibacteria group bacterium]